MAAFPGIDRAAARIETRLVLQEQDRGLDRVHRRAAFVQHLCPCIERGLQGGAVRCVFFARHVLARNRACSAMDGEGPARLGRFTILGRRGDLSGERESRENEGEAGEKSSHARVIAGKVIHSTPRALFV